MGGLVELDVEVEERSRAKHAVARQFELVHGVHVQHVKPVFIPFRFFTMAKTTKTNVLTSLIQKSDPSHVLIISYCLVSSRLSLLVFFLTPTQLENNVARRSRRPRWQQGLSRGLLRGLLRGGVYESVFGMSNAHFERQ